MGLLLILWFAANIWLQNGVGIWSALPFLGGLYLLFAASREHVRLSAEQLDYFNGFSTSTVRKCDVEGYRRLNRFSWRRRSRVSLVIELKPVGAAPVHLPLWILEHPDVAPWFAGLKDIDAEAEAECHVVEAATPAFGADPNARVARAQFLKRLIGGVTVLGFAALAVAFLANGASWAAVPLMALPFIAVLLDIAYPGQLRFLDDQSEVDARPSMFQLVMFPALFLSFLVLERLQLVTYHPLFLPALAAAVIAVFYVRLRSPGMDWSAMLFGFGVCVFFYTGSALAYADEMFDTAPTRIVSTVVVDHHVNHGRSTSYTVSVAPWRAGGGATDFSVTSAEYLAWGLGATVCVREGKGALGWAWVKLKSCRSGGVHDS